MKSIICGGRNYADLTNKNKKISVSKYEIKFVKHMLSYLKNRLGLDAIKNGGAKGVDSCAHSWANENDVHSARYPADWAKYGKGAGPIRNAQMLEDNDVDVVVSFPGGNGTEDMIAKAKAKNVPVLMVSHPAGMDFLSISRAAWSNYGRRYYSTMGPYTDSYIDWTRFNDLSEVQKDYWRACAQREFLFNLSRRLELRSA